MSTDKPVPASKYRDALRAAIVRFTPADRDDVLAFRREMYGPASIYADAAYLRWMYDVASDGTGARGLQWLYRKDAKVQGQQGALPMTIEVRGESHRALWVLDLMVSPPHRLRGIGVVLAEAAFGETGLVFGTEISADAEKAFRRAGWTDMGTLPLYFRPLDFALLAKARLHNRLTTVLGQAGTVALRLFDRVLLTALGMRGLRLQPILEFDERSDRLWRDVSPNYPVAGRRDAEFLNWRFARFPAQRYRMFYAFRRDELVGHVVIRSGEWNGLPAGFVVDFLCAPRWTTALLAAALSQFRNESLAGVYCMHLNPVSTKPLRNLGFVRRDSGWRFMMLARDVPQDVQTLMGDPASWFLTAADSDLDRPHEGTVFATGTSWGAAATD